jgi:hypothetical protein
MVSDFHAYLTAAGLEFMKKSSTIFSRVLANFAVAQPCLDQFPVLHVALLGYAVPNDLRRESFKIDEVTGAPLPPQGQGETWPYQIVPRSPFSVEAQPKRTTKRMISRSSNPIYS